MNLQNKELYNGGEEAAKKENLVVVIFRWFMISMFILIVGIVIFRQISSATPRKLQNYLISNPEIKEAYMDLKDDLKIYQIDTKIHPYDVNEIDDALSIEKVYYIEDTEFVREFSEGTSAFFARIVLLFHI